MNRNLNRLGFLLCLVIGLSTIAPSGAADENLRPEIGKPLKAAQALISAQKYREALAKVAEVDSIPNQTAAEHLIIERMRGSVALAAGDIEIAARAFEAVIATNKLSQEENAKLMQALSGAYYRSGTYAKAAVWAQRYLDIGGDDPNTGQLLIQAEYLGGNYTKAAQALQTRFSADRKAGRKPAEDQLRLLAGCYQKLGDNSGYVSALEMLVADYPKADYWRDLVTRVQRQPGFADRLTLDVYRLMRAVGILQDASDYMEMAQLAIQAGFPTEAKAILEDGFKQRILGAGNDTERQLRLRDLAAKQSAADQKVVAESTALTADALINNGYNDVVNGRYDSGIELLKKGLSGSGAKRPEEARLHLGLAYWIAGRKAEAASVLATVQGTDGTGALARLWNIYIAKAS
ncbi:MAG: tetratricopeptide repeat protein [Nevskia sp.]|jgi:tetratricopeptide (TPR) repeat protein|nr:tetratricopeptide repeat protein [Nevskia sp.]